VSGGTPWTCPAIDRLLRLARRHLPEPDRSAAVLDLETLRAHHILLRAAAADCDPQGLRPVLDRIGQALARYDRLVEDDRLDDEVIALARRAAPTTYPPPEDP
jgi:hypothetical protein